MYLILMLNSYNFYYKNKYIINLFNIKKKRK